MLLLAAVFILWWWGGGGRREGEGVIYWWCDSIEKLHTTKMETFPKRKSSRMEGGRLVWWDLVWAKLYNSVEAKVWWRDCTNARETVRK